MPVSHLTTSVDALWALVLSEMSADGHNYDPLQQGMAQILDQIVTDVGGSDVSYLTSSPTQMLAAAVNALVPGSASHLTMGYAELLAALVNALQATAPGSPDTNELLADTGQPILADTGQPILVQ